MTTDSLESVSLNVCSPASLAVGSEESNYFVQIALRFSRLASCHEGSRSASDFQVHLRASHLTAEGCYLIHKSNHSSSMALNASPGAFKPIELSDNPRAWKGDIGLMNSSKTSVVFTIDSLVSFLKTVHVEVDSNLNGAFIASTCDLLTSASRLKLRPTLAYQRNQQNTSQSLSIYLDMHLSARWSLWAYQTS
jgi:hypothetical protein